MTEIIPYLSLAALFVVLFFVTRTPPRHTTFQENHTIPHAAALKIATAQFEGQPAIFHGGCQRCIWRHQNTTHAGIAFCRGCQYFTANWHQPDKSINEYDLEKL